MRWYFTPRLPDSKIRDPIQGEFFANETIGNPGEALIREGIQNALDASTGDGIVTVRIYVSGEEHSVPSTRLSRYMEGAWDHINAPGNGLSDIPTSTDPSPFLLFEDFGTTGLTGDVEQWKTLENVRNHFFYFFRAEGRTDKGEHDRGRWGVGKYVFPQASSINTIFATTVRADDRKKLLMGQAVLKSHEVLEQSYSPDGWYGIKHDGKPVLPIADSTAIEDFSEIFGLQRGDEPGLSLVVPWYQLDMTGPELIKGVIKHYFYPIIQEQLQVIVETPEIEIILDPGTLIDEIRTLGSEFRNQMKSIIDLAKWSASLKPSAIPMLNEPDSMRAPKWESDLIPEELAEDFRSALRERGKFAARVPVYVRRKPDITELSHFDAFIAADDNPSRDRPVFVRGGVIISDVKSHRTRGVRAIVVAEDTPLATLLGDAENPAHTQWQWGGSNFKNKYFFGRSVIEFVRESVHEMVGILTREETEADPHLLADIFELPPIPEAEETPGKAKKPRTEPGREPRVPPEITPRPKRFRVNKIRGGFSISCGDPDAPLPEALQVKVAYDVRRGNALARYSTADFELNKAPILFSPPPRNAEILEIAGNQMKVKITDAKFELNVSGFDPNRDLLVRVVAVELANGD